jgi:hypothetical protein
VKPTKTATSIHDESVDQTALADVTRELSADYRVSDSNALERYLVQRPQLIPVLQEAHTVVHQYFPDSVLELAISNDVEDEGEEAFIYIHTHLPVQDAMARLDKLDEAWFLEADARSGYSFNINLRFE